MDNLQLSQGGSFALASGALANGTNAGTIKTTVAIPFTVDGRFYSKAITDNIALVADSSLVSVYSNGFNTSGAVTGQVGGSTVLYGLYLDTGGNVRFLPGKVANTARLAEGTESLQFPPTIKGKACFGVLRIAVTANTTFTPGTTALDASGVTATYLNLMAIPGEALQA